MRSLALLLVLGLGACASEPAPSTSGSTATATEQAESPAPEEAPSPEEAEVRTAIDQLFDGMRAGDSAAVRAAFNPEAQLFTTANREGEPVMQVGSIDEFVTAVGTPHDEVWDERISNVEIRVDDNLATAWMDYSFYLGDQFSHCGVNAFQFFRGTEGWKVIQITDTRRQEAC